MPITNEVVTGSRVVFPCPNCGHNNCPQPKTGERQGVAAVILWLKNQIPPCKKCGCQLHKSDFGGLPESSVYMVAAKRRLGNEDVR